MEKELLLGKIIDAEGNEFELPLESENPNEIYETLKGLQDGGMIRLGHFMKDGNSISLRADVLSDFPDQPPNISQMIFEKTKKVVSEAFDEMQAGIDRLNNKIVELEKQLAER